MPSTVVPNYDKEVLAPLHKAQAVQAAADAAKAAEDAETARKATEAANAAYTAPTQVVYSAPRLNTVVFGDLTGTIGYALPYGNCVNEPGVKNPFDGTNPISWPVFTQTPYIGATFLFWTNHTGVVTGIWSNGDIEVRHQNFQGGVHRFPRSMFRGFR